MLSASREFRGTKLVLLLAAVLSFAASFGLHPEPFRSPDAAVSVDEVLRNADSRSAKPAHGCLACLAHRSVPLPLLSGVVMHRGPSLLLSAAVRESRAGRVAFFQHEGRAPPAVS